VNPGYYGAERATAPTPALNAVPAAAESSTEMPGMNMPAAETGKK
jgi:hypothetical protein